MVVCHLYPISGHIDNFNYTTLIVGRIILISNISRSWIWYMV